MKKKTFRSLVKLLQENQKCVIEKVLIDYKEQFETIPGSITKHQAWVGGYKNHVEEVMNIACLLYRNMNKARQLPFSLSDALFTLFCHDLDKLIAYQKKGEVYVRVLDHHSAAEAALTLIEQTYSYTLSFDEKNALHYVHGEGKDYHPTERIMGPLATFIHCCDVISARIWFDEGKDSKHW